MRNNHIPFQFNKLNNASLPTEWFLFLFGTLLCLVSIMGNGYVSYRLLRIVRVSKAIQTPIYLSLTICGLCTGVFCMPYMLYSLYARRIINIPAAYAQEATTTPYLFNSTASTGTFATSSFITTTAESRCRDEARDMAWSDRIFCNISGTVLNTTSRLLVWFMLLLSIDRYIFICLPYRIHLVKKRHYAIWIAASCFLTSAMSIAPYIFYYPEVERPFMVKGCPTLLYQPYKFDLKTRYQCDYSIHILLNTIDLKTIISFYVVTIVMLCLVPITLNVTLSMKVLYEVSKMRKIAQTNTQPTLKSNCQYQIPNCETPFITQTIKETSLMKKFVGDVSMKLQIISTRISKRRHGQVIENKASFTMLILSLFYILTYSAWVLVWCFGLAQCFNSFGSEDNEWMWLWLYNSKDPLAQIIMNHYPMATFANAAFVPCLLAYSLHKAKG